MELFGDLLAGTVGGVVGKYVELPFDTVKMRMQMLRSPYRNTQDCVRRIANEEGLRGFYLGAKAPLCAAAFENAAAFATYSVVSGMLDRRAGIAPDAASPLHHAVLAGMAAGVGNTTVLTPVELIRCRMQAHPSKYPNVSACIQDLLKKEGPSAFTIGWRPTLLREVFGTGAWFLSYEATLRTAFLPPGASKDAAPWYAYRRRTLPSCTRRRTSSTNCTTAFHAARSCRSRS